jgi:ABC-type multidrug transport system fused ATPase/permease subunit
VDAYCNLRFTQSAFDTTTLRTIERPDVADKMSHANETFEQWGLTPGSATEGALALTARYVQLAAALVIVAVAFGRQVMVAAAVVALVARRGQSAGFFRWGQVIRALRPMQRKLAYVRDVATGSGAAKEIRTLGLVDWIDRRYVAEDAAYLDTMWTWRRRVYGRPFAVYALIALVATGVALTVASSKSVAGDLSIGAVVLGVQGIVLCARFGVLFPESDVKMVFGRAGWDAVLEFQEICRTSDEEAGADVVPVREEGSAATATSPYRPVTGIAFENVRFAYDTHEVLHGLDLTLPVGTSTALVGVNGAGKTTLIKLLTGLYAPTSGRIAVDGVDLRTIPSSTWQRVFAVTFQDYNRYEMSLRDNVAMGCIAHRDDTDGIIASVRRAGLGDLLGELPGGIDTPLTQHVEGGRELSGGQWQRLALARHVRHPARCQHPHPGRTDGPARRAWRGGVLRGLPRHHPRSDEFDHFSPVLVHSPGGPHRRPRRRPHPRVGQPRRARRVRTSVRRHVLDPGAPLRSERGPGMKDSLFCLRRLTAIAYRCDRRRFLIGAALVMAGGLATPIVAVALKALINAVSSSDAGDAVSWGLVATAAIIGELMLGHFAHLYYFEVSELTEERLTRRLLRLVNGTPVLERNDDPAFADRVELLRQDVVTMRTTVQSGMQLSALALQLFATAVVLALLSPVLLLLLVVAALPIITGRRAEQVLIEARERIAPQQREIRHLRALSSSPGSQKEVRLSGSA